MTDCLCVSWCGSVCIVAAVCFCVCLQTFPEHHSVCTHICVCVCARTCVCVCVCTHVCVCVLVLTLHLLHVQMIDVYFTEADSLGLCHLLPAHNSCIDNMHYSNLPATIKWPFKANSGIHTVRQAPQCHYFISPNQISGSFYRHCHHSKASQHKTSNGRTRRAVVLFSHDNPTQQFNDPCLDVYLQRDVFTFREWEREMVHKIRERGRKKEKERYKVRIGKTKKGNMCRNPSAL